MQRTRVLFTSKFAKQFWIPAVTGSVLMCVFCSQLTLSGWRTLAMIVGGLSLVIWFVVAWMKEHLESRTQMISDDGGADGGAGVTARKPFGPPPLIASDRKGTPLRE